MKDAFVGRPVSCKVNVSNFIDVKTILPVIHTSISNRPFNC